MGVKLDDLGIRLTLADEKFLTVQEIAIRYRTSAGMVYRWVSEKRFPEKVVVRLGRKILFHSQNLEVFETQGGDLFIEKLPNFINSGGI